MDVQSFSDPSRIRATITDQHLRILQIIYTAIAGSVLTFAIVVLAIANQASVARPDESMAELLAILSIVHLALGFSCYSAALVLFNVMMSPRRLADSPPLAISPQTGGVPSHAGLEKALAVLRSASIARLALFEAPAFLGLTLCLLTIINGLTEAHPEYLLNALSTLILLLFVAVCFPTRERMVAVFQERLTLL